MLAVVGTTWFFTSVYFVVNRFMNDQTIGDPNDPDNPYRYMTVDQFNEKLKNV